MGMFADMYYLRSKTEFAGTLPISKFSKNRQSGVESFSMRSELSNDMRFAWFGQCRTNWLLRCKVALFCEDLGLHYTHAISFGDFVGYTSIPWAHYGSLESSGVDLAPRKIQFYKKKSIFDAKHLFLDPRPGSKSLLPRGLKSRLAPGSKKGLAHFFWSIVVTKLGK